MISVTNLSIRSSHGVVVMSPVSHAEGSEFESLWDQKKHVSDQGRFCVGEYNKEIPPFSLSLSTFWWTANF